MPDLALNTRNCLGQNLALTLYKSSILPHIDLRHVVYQLASAEMTKELQIVPDAACWVILLCRKDSTGMMHKNLDLLQLKDRRSVHLDQPNHKNVLSWGSLSKLLIRRIGSRVHRTRHIG